MTENGDSNNQQERIKFIRNLQKETYGELTSKLLEDASHHYLSLSRVFHFQPKLRDQPSARLEADHHVLRSIYLCMADSFFVFCAKEVFSSPTKKQEDVTEALNSAWKQFFALEAHRLVQIPSFVERLMEILASDSKSGGTAREEAELLKFMQKEYPAGD